jgi:hypothetical protein
MLFLFCIARFVSSMSNLNVNIPSEDWPLSPPGRALVLIKRDVCELFDTVLLSGCAYGEAPQFE